MKSEDSLLVMLWVDRLMGRSRSQTPNKPDNSLSRSGQPLSNENTTPSTKPAEPVADAATPSTAATESQFENPLAAQCALDSEQFQGCRTPGPVVIVPVDPDGVSQGYGHGYGRQFECSYQPPPFLGNDLYGWQPRYGDVSLVKTSVERTESYVTYTGQVSGPGLPTEDAARKELKLWDFQFGYFPDAWLAVVRVAVAGNKQHNPGEPLHWAREKSTDQLNTAFRHQWDYGRGIKKDTDGQYHLAKAIWRLSAQLQLDIEAERNGNK